MLTDRDRHKLQGCHHEIIAKVDRVFEAVARHGKTMMVTDGARTASQQAVSYAKGRTTVGPDVSPDRPLGRTVTSADGVHIKSNHQSGRAVDCCFVVNGEPSWDEHLPWYLYGEAAEAEGLHWGGRWARHDNPHIELNPLPAGSNTLEV